MNQYLVKVGSRLLLLAAIGFSSAATQAQIAIPPTSKVTPDTGKPGFNWTIFANQANQANDDVRPENALAGLLVDADGNPLPNLADPAAQGVAIAISTAPSPANAPIKFEIDTVINVSHTAGTTLGTFTPDEQMPGVPATDGSNNGLAVEILTYLDLPAGVTTMGVTSDDGFVTSAGNVVDAFGRVVLGSFVGGRGAGDTIFTLSVAEAGVYPFRTVYEQGGGDANIEWWTSNSTTRVLVNDTANGGIKAYRAQLGTIDPYVKSVSPSPAPRQLEKVSPSLVIALADGNPKTVDDNSIVLQYDGATVTPTKARQGSTVTLTYTPSGLQLPGERHTATLAFKDSTGTFSRTNQWTFYNMENLILPASPVTGENFDSYPESTSAANTVPPGWVATNLTYPETDNAGWDLTFLHSEAFMDMVIISTNNVFPLEDEVLLNDTTQTINGIPLTNGWMSGNLLFSASDGRSRRDPDGNLVAQLRIVVSAPFNLATVTNPVLTFSSGARLSTANWEQMTMEYSIDGGTNWLPVIYMRNASTIQLQSDGSYDVLAMFNTVNTNQIPLWPTPGVGPLGGKFGDMIAAPISQALAPYIANRNDGIAARKVEAIRLPQASRQSDVRLRLTHLGSCGWEWGIDNIAFYDIAPTTAPAAPSTTINIDFNDTSAGSTNYSGTAAAPDSGTTWNGVAIVPGATFTSGALLASDGSATPVTVSLGNFLSYSADEKPAALATALLTEFAYQPRLGPGGPDSTFSINNLDPAAAYDLYLYAQNGGYGTTVTIFTINGASQYATNAGNVASFIQGTNYVVYSGLVPNASGVISGTFNVIKVADNAAFNGLQIMKATTAPPPTGPKITSIAATGGQITIQWTGGGTLESTTSLTAPVWTSTGNSSGSFSEPVPATGNKFYRVKL